MCFALTYYIQATVNHYLYFETLVFNTTLFGMTEY